MDLQKMSSVSMLTLNLIFCAPVLLAMLCRSREMRCCLYLVLVCVAALFPSGLCQDSCRVSDGKPGEKGSPGWDGLPGPKGEKGEPCMYDLVMCSKALKHYDNSNCCHNSSYGYKCETTSA